MATYGSTTVSRRTGWHDGRAQGVYWGADDPEESTESEGKYSELPEAGGLLDQHYNALRDMVFASEEKFVNRDSTMTDRTIRRGDTGTLVKGNDVARNINSDGKQRVWFSGNARVSRATHRFNPTASHRRLLTEQ